MLFSRKREKDLAPKKKKKNLSARGVPKIAIKVV